MPNDVPALGHWLGTFWIMLGLIFTAPFWLNKLEPHDYDPDSYAEYCS
jgi:hypothetical protein